MNNNDKEITCYDISGNRYSTPVRELSFRPSVYGVIIQDSRVLLSKQWDGYDFPGGGVELGETVEDALLREVKEETGLDVKVGKIVSCENSFFKLPYKGNCVQSILIYYLCEVLGGELSTKFLDKHEKRYTQAPGWVDLSKIGEIKIYNSVDSVALVQEAVRIATYACNENKTTKI